MLFKLLIAGHAYSGRRTDHDPVVVASRALRVWGFLLSSTGKKNPKSTLVAIANEDWTTVKERFETAVKETLEFRDERRSNTNTSNKKDKNSPVTINAISEGRFGLNPSLDICKSSNFNDTDNLDAMIANPDETAKDPAWFAPF